MSDDDDDGYGDEEQQQQDEIEQRFSVRGLAALGRSEPVDPRRVLLLTKHISRDDIGRYGCLAKGPQFTPFSSWTPESDNFPGTLLGKE
ncbi:uncharacterized protein BO88DRAFT_448400 [Aspergillus vadensis CBS 113365]|uniref:Uncharacterized protein n=1 Tax=Aspergillus vadensis (strain CBS 113365 / IMI 142717 / IBT 24658) TaxID=1448311 RepID=A0A319D3D2_ASPVC|nr:hypothetical protein BO88DRAFT_448400 [Aspergillus vadensis CBS 113365]PYH74592.1 hypothetical protein BO88DRAFT_448400 [Aspergillus vadensis CBS 113365]